MIELITTIGTTVASVLLFAYWFRYSCLLILSAKTAHNYAGELVLASGLHIDRIQAQLQSDSSTDLTGLSATLERDFAAVRKLLQCVRGESTIENRMLHIHYRVNQVWFRVTRSYSAVAARRALEEMSMVLAHFANIAGGAAAEAA